MRFGSTPLSDGAASEDSPRDPRDALVWSVSFQMLESVLEPRSAAYVSGPLQTGLLYYKAMSGRLSAETNVRELNGKRLTAFARALRRKLDYPVLDPGLLVVDGWTGREYLALYLAILRRYAKEVWFIDGWQYSSGATAEFRVAMQARVPCLDADGRRLSRARGEELVAIAAAEVTAWGCEPPVLGSHAA